MKRRKILIGDKFGNFTVIEGEVIRIKKRLINCRCICGKEKYIYLTHLTTGKTTCCGCLTPTIGDRNRTHGMTYSPEYKIWRGILDRCFYPSHKSYKTYGGRGISCCKEWRNSFETFYADMGPRPTPRHSIDRINGGKGYEPRNCRWATLKEQTNNRSFRCMSSTGIIGVHKTKFGFYAQLGIDGKKIYLGSFGKIEDAIIARENAEKQYGYKCKKM